MKDSYSKSTYRASRRHAHQAKTMSYDVQDDIAFEGSNIQLSR